MIETWFHCYSIIKYAEKFFFNRFIFKKNSLFDKFVDIIKIDIYCETVLFFIVDVKTILLHYVNYIAIIFRMFFANSHFVFDFFNVNVAEIRFWTEKNTAIYCSLLNITLCSAKTDILFTNILKKDTLGLIFHFFSFVSLYLQWAQSNSLSACLITEYNSFRRAGDLHRSQRRVELHDTSFDLSTARLKPSRLSSPRHPSYLFRSSNIQQQQFPRLSYKEHARPVSDICEFEGSRRLWCAWRLPGEVYRLYGHCSIRL